MKRSIRAVGLVATVAVTAAAQNATSPPTRPSSSHASAGDPAIPPALRKGSREPSPSGAALDALVERKLRRQFDAADVSGSGRITREQAAAAGWGSIAQQFDRIDESGRGAVSFDEIRRYLRAQARR